MQSTVPRNGPPAGEAGDGDAATEEQLLGRFVSLRDEEAFAILVERHGPKVLGVCRQLLNDSHDVEDAFQSTFLVLARKAGSMRQPQLLGNWLYGVAYRVAVRARAKAHRRHEIERRGAEISAPDPTSSEARDDLAPQLHDEVNRLPDKYRLPIVLCYLEGLSHQEAARRLHWPVGTVKGRLSRAREQLRDRLSRRGLALPAALLVLLLNRSGSAEVPGPLRVATIRASMGVASGREIRGSELGEGVAALTSAILQEMARDRWIRTASLVMVLGLLLSGGLAALAWWASGEQSAIGTMLARHRSRTVHQTPEPQEAGPCGSVGVEQGADVSGEPVSRSASRSTIASISEGPAILADGPCGPAGTADHSTRPFAEEAAGSSPPIEEGPGRIDLPTQEGRSSGSP